MKFRCSLLHCIYCAAVLACTSCYTVPETGRTSVILPIFDDAKMGADAFAQAKAKEHISADPAAIARVQRVGARIAQSVGSNLPGAQWEFVVFEAPETVNAYALPGGKVAVYTGLLKLATSDDELAFVMGHEIAHVTSRHGAERMTKQVAIAGLGAVADIGTKDSKYHDLVLLSYGGLGALGTLAFSRENESEADYVGLRYSAKAGYNPQAAIEFWEKMAEQGSKSGRPPEFLSTHPADQRRIDALRKELPEVMPIYQQAKARE